MLTIHDPSKMKERQNVKPLTMEDAKKCIDALNTTLNYMSSLSIPVIELEKLLQRLVWEYENLKHMEAYTNNFNHGKIHENNFVCGLDVNYELVEPVKFVCPSNKDNFQDPNKGLM